MYVIVLAGNWFLAAYSPGDEGNTMSWRTDHRRAMRFGSRTAATSCLHYLGLSLVAEVQRAEKE